MVLLCVRTVVTDVTEDTDSSDADGLVSSVLDDTSGLLTELNEEGADVSGASTQAVSANNCTANTFVANSDRSITGTPCFGVTNEACGFTCNDGYTKFGDHICNPDGTFCESPHSSWRPATDCNACSLLVPPRLVERIGRPTTSGSHTRRYQDRSRACLAAIWIHSANA